LPYISALILPFVPIHKPLITISITCLSLIPNVIKLDPTAIALLVIAILTHIFNHGIAWNSFQQTKPRCPLSSKYLIFIYLFSFSLLSISNIKLTHYVALILLYIMLIIYLTIAESNMYLRYAVVPICYATLLWGIISYVTLTSELSYFNPIRYCV
jgi:hypothetical protein